MADDSSEITAQSQGADSKKPKKDYQVSTSSVNRYDQYSLKAQIDEEIVEWLENKKFVENTNWIGIKILLTGLACVLGYVSHFMCKFPRDYLGVMACVAGYAVLMGLNYLIESRVEKESFFMSKANPDTRFKNY